MKKIPLILSFLIAFATITKAQTHWYPANMYFNTSTHMDSVYNQAGKHPVDKFDDSLRYNHNPHIGWFAECVDDSGLVKWMPVDIEIAEPKWQVVYGYDDSITSGPNFTWNDSLKQLRVKNINGLMVQADSAYPYRFGDMSGVRYTGQLNINHTGKNFILLGKGRSASGLFMDMETFNATFEDESNFFWFSVDSATARTIFTGVSYAMPQNYGDNPFTVLTDTGSGLNKGRLAWLPVASLPGNYWGLTYPYLYNTVGGSLIFLDATDDIEFNCDSVRNRISCTATNPTSGSESHIFVQGGLNTIVTSTTAFENCSIIEDELSIALINTSTTGDSSFNCTSGYYSGGYGFTYEFIDLTHDNIFHYPNLDGQPGAAMITDGSGNLSFSNLIYSGSFSQAVTAVSSFTVTIGSTLANSTYKVNVTGSNILSSVAYYVDTKTTTQFTVHSISALTGTVAFDWILAP